MRRFGARNVEVSFSAESLTHFGGLLLIHRFLQRLGFRTLLAHRVQFPQRNNRYAISESLLALLYPLILGLGRLETTRLLQRNGVFQYLTGLPVYPDPQTLRRFLIRLGEAGLDRLTNLHDALRLQLWRRPLPRPSMIFDLDTTVLTVYGAQEKSAIGYNPKKQGRPSYVPLLCFEGQTGECWEASYHSGNVSAATVVIPLLERAFTKVPDGVREVRMRGDSAFYAHALIEFLEGKRASYAIVARLTPALKERVAAARYHRISGSVYAADFPYHPRDWPGPRRFVAIRRPVKEEPSYQLTLWRLGHYTYHVIVTNLPLTPLHVWRFYNQRARAELIIRELKEAYALGKIPTQNWQANVAYFQLVTLAYNLLAWFKRLCVPPEWQRLTLQTLRNRLFLIPAEFVRPHGVPTLKMPHGYPYEKQFLKTMSRIESLRLT